MNWKACLLIYLSALVVLLIFAAFQNAPGYMDAEYYYSMGLRIARDNTLLEPFIWNFLNQPANIPHPGFTFWMPLPSILAAGGIMLTGLKNFYGARAIFLVLAPLVPVLTFRISRELTGDVKTALLAGALAVFPFLYSPFLGTTDSFAISMVLGAIFFSVVNRSARLVGFLVLGVLAGLMHLTRADGFIWVGAGLLAVLLGPGKKYKRLALILLGYLAVMGIWFFRNWQFSGQVMPGGTARMFWLTQYNDLFTFYPDRVTFQSWAGQGAGKILRALGRAAWANLKTILAVQGQILLVPLVVMGFRRHWQLIGIRVYAATGLAVFCVMSFIFPFAGMRGGMFHSGAAFQPLLWACAASGFEVMISWGIQTRSWVQPRARIMFGSALVAGLAGLTVFSLFSRVVGSDFQDPIWNESNLAYQALGKELEFLGIEESALILINNPPGFYAATGRSAVVLPNGGVDVLLDAAEKYRLEYAVLDHNHPDGLAALYAHPELETRLTYLGTGSGFQVFYIPE